MVTLLRVRGSMVVVGSVLIAACAGGVGLAGPAAADGGTQSYAYADGAATPSGCPREATSSNGCSLATALADAAAGDTVLLATAGASAHYLGNWTLATSGTTASMPVSIQPASGVSAPVLDGGGGSGPNGSILEVKAGVSATITGVTFTDGANDGAVHIDGAGGIVTVRDSTFSDNNAENGAAIDNTVDASLTVSDSTFTGNHAGYGGAIATGLYPTGSGTVSVTDSTFTNNSAYYTGGAIVDGYNNGANQASLTVADSTFTGNTANDGGAIDTGDTFGTGSLSVSGSTFVRNSAESGANYNGATPDGGAIDNGDGGTGVASVSASTFTGNSAAVGADLNNASSAFLAGDLFADSCAQTSGTWTDEGFNVDADGSCLSNGPGDVMSAKVSNLGALQDNGGPTMTVAPYSSNPAIRNVPSHTTVTLNGASVTLCPTTDQRGVATVAGQPCSAGAVSAGELFAYADGGDAGGSGCPAVTVTADGCSLAGAFADAVPGDTVLLATAGASASYQGNWTLATAGAGPRAPVTIQPAGDVVDPTLDGHGSTGPILNLTNGVSAAITGVSLANGDNTTTGGGGAIDTGDGTPGGMLTVTDATFTGNTSAGNGGTIDVGDDGGSGKVTVTDSTFAGGTAAGNGGAIDVGDDSGAGSVTAISSNFSGDMAADGGAIDAGDDGGSGTVTAVTSTFKSSKAVYAGGAIDVGDDGGSGTASVSNSTFTSNQGGFQGGAINVGDNAGSGSLSVTSSTFTGNTTPGQGGAIDSADNDGSGAVSVTQSTFYANQASNSGGAIANVSGGGLGTVTILGSTFADNAATNDGGAIDNSDGNGSGTLTMSESTLFGNRAGSDGGGIDTSDHGGSGNATVSTTTLTANKAPAGGAGDVDDNGGNGGMFVAGDLFNGSCAAVRGALADRGFNAATDRSCLGGSPTSSDRVSTAVADLEPLHTYGGPTATVPVAAANPALRRIPPSTRVSLDGIFVQLCARTDQRGVASPAGAACDAGAMQSAADSVTGSGSPSSITTGKVVALTARVTPSTGLPAALPAPTGTLIFTLGSKVVCSTTALTLRAGTTPVAGACTSKKLPKGTDRIVATYESTDGYATTTTEFTEHVRPPKPKKKKRH